VFLVAMLSSAAVLRSTQFASVCSATPPASSSLAWGHDFTNPPAEPTFDLVEDRRIFRILGGVMQ
jgi:hypothetical protein